MQTLSDTNWFRSKLATTSSAIVIFGATCLCTACTTSKAQASQELGGLVTVSALVVAMPLIPFGTAYRAISDVHERKAERELQARLDPVYRERTEMIRRRDPRADADHAVQIGAVAFLPTVPDGVVFVGLERTQYFVNKQFSHDNYKRVLGNEFLKYLDTLMSKDPTHVENKSIQYFDESYRRFIEAKRDYQQGFNQHMYEVVQAKGLTVANK